MIQAWDQYKLEPKMAVNSYVFPLSQTSNYFQIISEPVTVGLRGFGRIPGIRLDSLGFLGFAGIPKIHRIFFHFGCVFAPVRLLEGIPIFLHF